MTNFDLWESKCTNIFLQTILNRDYVKWVFINDQFRRQDKPVRSAVKDNCSKKPSEMAVLRVFLAIILCQAGQTELQCPVSCQSCSRQKTCYSCKPGYFNDTRRLGECTPCPKGCTDCSSWLECLSCESGYFLSNGWCYSCSDNQRYGQCSKGCAIGFYGQLCDVSCSEGCRGKECDKQSGRCVNGCLDGYYGETCQRCSEWCLNRVCQEFNGQCTHGCVDGYYEYERRCEMCSDNCKTCSSWFTCTSCYEGFYNYKCDISCPYCRPGGCYFKNGTCTNGCKDGYYQGTNMCLHCPDNCFRCTSTIYCEECLSGFFETTCEQRCPYNCLSCDDNINCNMCVAGYFGQSCDKNCSQTCNGCKKESGLCKDCIDGYFKEGDKCLPCPDGCNGCYADKTCSSCRTGHYLSSKSRSCPACGQSCMSCASPDACLRCFSGYVSLNGICVPCNNCINVTECTSKTGCSQCQNGHWGTYCTNKCGMTCILCNKDTGECVNCTRHTFGRFCELSCSSNCPKTLNAVSSCFQENGTYLYGCVSGFRGHNCTEEIPTFQQRTMVLAITGSALGVVVIVAAALTLILLVRSRRNRVTRSPVCVGSNRQHVRRVIPNPTYDASIGIVNMSEVKPNADDHVYAVVHKVQVKLKRANGINQSEADNVYDVTSTERPQAKAQWPTRTGASKTGEDSYSHISHVNKMGRSVNENQMNCETVYDHIARDMGRQCNEGTYDAGSIQPHSWGRRTERVPTMSTKVTMGDDTYI